MDELHAAGPAPSRSVLTACRSREDDALADENDDSQHGSARSSMSATSSQAQGQDPLSNIGYTSSAELRSTSTGGSGSRRGSKESICSTDSGFGQGSDRTAIKRKEATRRRNKAHVSTACYPCKRAHLACETSRPCKRCVNLEKEDQCIDVAHKRRGRPRIKDTVAAKAGPPRDSLNHFQAAVQTADVLPKRVPAQGTEDNSIKAPNHIDLQPRSLSTDLRFGLQPGGGTTPPISFASAAVTPGWHERQSSLPENSYMFGRGNYEVAPTVAPAVTAALILSMDMVVIRATDEVASWLKTTAADLAHRPLTQLTMDEDLPHLHALQQALTQDAADLLGVQPKIAQQLHPRALLDALAIYTTVELTVVGPRPYPVRQAGLALRQATGGRLPATLSLWLGNISASTFPYLVAVIRKESDRPASQQQGFFPQLSPFAMPGGQSQYSHAHPYVPQHQQGQVQKQASFNTHEVKTTKSEEEKKPLSFLDPGFDWAGATAAAAARKQAEALEKGPTNVSVVETRDEKAEASHARKTSLSLASVMN